MFLPALSPGRLVTIDADWNKHVEADTGRI
jgi:hypothetical protein